jgi:hypothetical protein
MGCCSSSTDNKPLVSNQTSGVGSNPNPVAGQPSSPKRPVDGSSSKEDQIKLALKTKRANIFTESVNVDERRAFHAKVVPKTPAQENVIRTYYCHVV